MIESLIITLREGIEISLVLGILVAYLRKSGRHRLLPAVYGGLAAAVLASAGGAVILQRLAIDQESLEGWFMLAAALFVSSMVAWMWFTAKRIRTGIEHRVGAIAGATEGGIADGGMGDGGIPEGEISGGGTTFPLRVHAGIFGFTFLMIVREGIETAMFLQAVAFSTGAWQSAAGTGAGLIAATVFAVLFIRGSVRIDLPRFMRITAITLLLFTLQLVVNAVHEFFEYGVLPASPRMMGILGPIVQNNTLFIIAIVIIPGLMFLIPSRARTGQRRWQLVGAFASIVVVLFLGVGEIYSSAPARDFTARRLTVPSDGLLRIPISSVGDGVLHRFAIADSGLEIRFFVLRTGMGKIATAFDACYACYSYGRYYLKGGQLICSQCDAPSPLSKLNPATEEEPKDDSMSGSMEGNGCAPIYLRSHVRDGAVEIRLADLQRKRKYFDIAPGE